MPLRRVSLMERTEFGVGTLPLDNRLPIIPIQVLPRLGVKPCLFQAVRR
jgi:hypothetical protein